MASCNPSAAKLARRRHVAPCIVCKVEHDHTIKALCHNDTHGESTATLIFSSHPRHDETLIFFLAMPAA